MEEIIWANWEWNLVILQQMEWLLECFVKEGIVYVYLKGVVMIGGSYYQDNVECMFWDIDVFIVFGDQIKVYQFLKEWGYVEVLVVGLQYKMFSDYEREKYFLVFCYLQEIVVVELYNYFYNIFQCEWLKIECVIDNWVNGDIVLFILEDLFWYNIYNWYINDFGGVKFDVYFWFVYDILVFL